MHYSECLQPKHPYRLWCHARVLERLVRPGQLLILVQQEPAVAAHFEPTDVGSHVARGIFLRDQVAAGLVGAVWVLERHRLPGWEVPVASMCQEPS